MQTLPGAEDPRVKLPRAAGRNGAMLFTSIMHVSFYTEHFDEMADFYQNRLGLPIKVLVRFKEYLDRPDRSAMQKLAQKDPEGIFYVYFEIAPGQFIELFPATAGQKPHREWNEDCGYSHFALLTDDIFMTAEELASRGVKPDTAISKGPSGTYQQWYHDPDGNRFELMQYTEGSYQVIGHIG
jgi:lactoylglutathione lyase